MIIHGTFAVAALWASSAIQPVWTQADHECFFPNGDPDPKSSPCNISSIDNGGHSSCCIRNDPCFTDGTCATYNTNIPYRGSCTDESWTDGACPRDICMDSTQIGGVSWIIKCFPRNDTSCCLLGDDSCCFDDTFFTYNPGPMVALLDDNGNNVLATGTAPATGDASATATVTTTATATPSSSGSNSSGSQDSGTDPAVIGLGVALGVVILAGGLAVGLLWGKLQSERKGRPEQYFGGASTVGGDASSPVTAAASPPMQQPLVGYKPPENTEVFIPPQQQMSPQQMYTPTPVELHGTDPAVAEMWGQYQAQQPGYQGTHQQ